MKLAIMQPYFFPYWGYFQLINAADKFIFYDDVNYIKGGWINRNKIVVNNREHLITVPLFGISSFKKINEIQVNDKTKKILKTIEHAYKKAPNYEDTMQVLNETLKNIDNTTIADLAIKSVKEVCQYLEINTILEKSSIQYNHTSYLKASERILKLCEINEASSYINAAGGKKLYSKEEFQKKGIKLHFIQSHFFRYKQLAEEFLPGMSIIDLMMFNSPEFLKEQLDNYELQ